MGDGAVSAGDFIRLETRRDPFGKIPEFRFCAGAPRRPRSGRRRSSRGGRRQKFKCGTKIATLSAMTPERVPATIRTEATNLPARLIAAR